MNCEKCGKNQATIHTKIIMNGVATEKYLCASCWEEEENQMAGSFSFNDLLKGFMQQPTATQSVSCPACHMDLRTFKQGGLLGCAKCYETFAQLLEPTLKKIHGKALHEGKTPQRASSNAQPENEIDALKEKLADAVAKEDYENAAVIRDRIKELTKEGLQ